MGKIKKAFHNFQRYAGCVKCEEAYSGPRRVELYLTNRCNLDCIACWSFSPLLKGKHLPPQVDLDWERVQPLIQDLGQLGCEEIQLVGGGEPMIYPKIMEALQLIKSYNMRCFVTSNLTPITEKRAERMVELGIDRIYASVWAASPETYSATHPKSKPEDFNSIAQTLRTINQLKNGNRLASPQIIIHNVIFRQNHHEILQMIDFAREVGAAAVQFTMAYTFPGSTDVLLLDETMREEVLRQLDAIPKEVREMEGHHGPGSFLYEIDNFERRLRESAEGEGEYDRSILESIPCRIGWFFAIIQADGNVTPCCKGQPMPLGNIYEKTFREIWFSSTYDEFRVKAATLPKDDPYFAPINCYKMCDNIGMLKKIEKEVERLKPLEGPTRALAAPLFRRKKQ